MAVHGSPSSTPGDGTAAASGNPVVFRTGAVPSTPLRIHLVVSQATDGTSTAVVTLGGELCAFTAPALREELDRLLGHGVVGLVVDLGQLTLCTSAGLDLFAEVHARLQQIGVGTLELQGPVGVVARVLDVVQQADPEFTLRVQLDGSLATTPRPPSEPAEATPIDVLAVRIGHLIEDIDLHLSATAGEEE